MCSVTGTLYIVCVPTVALMVHINRVEAVDHAKALVTLLESLGHEVVLPPIDADAVGRPAAARSEDELDDAALAVSLGGDGTVLRTVGAVADAGVPVLGVNFGSLGYLTEIEPEESETAIRRFFASEHDIEERMRLAVRVDGESEVFHGLNEVVVEKIDSGRTVRLAVALNDDFFTTYAADGLIVATPTGSTAYSMSARGPIVDPTHRALLLTPVAPHSLFDRSLVLSPDDAVRIEVLDDREAAIALDGRIVRRLEVGEAVICSAAPPARLVSFGGKDFHRTLKSKFGLADR